jgi:hypothetical protein
LDRKVIVTAQLRSAPSEEAEVVRDLHAGEAFALLDDTLGWAWGYAGADHRVGYIQSQAVGPA